MLDFISRAWTNFDTKEWVDQSLFAFKVAGCFSVIAIFLGLVTFILAGVALGGGLFSW